MRNVIMMAHPDASDDDLINMIREDFSEAPTMNEAQKSCSTCVRNLKSKCVFTFTGMVACTRGHQVSGQLMRHDQHVIQDFIKSLKPKIKNKFANKFAEGRFQPRSLEQAFSLVLDLEKKIQIADSFRDNIMDSRTPAAVNEVQSFPLDESQSVNEVSSYRNNTAK